MNDFLKSKKLYMLFLLPFLVMAISLLCFYFPVTPVTSMQVPGVINVGHLSTLDRMWVMGIGFLAILGVSYLIFFINQKYKLLSQPTTLPSLIYVLLASGIIVNIGFDYDLLISVFILAIAASRLQSAITNTKSNSPIYDFGFCIMLAVAIYPKFVLLVLWALIVLLFSGRSTFKDSMALLLGFLTPVLFIVCYYFWTDRLVLLPTVFIDNLLMGEYIHDLPLMEYIRLGILFFLLVVALYNVMSAYPSSVVNQRRGILSVISMLLLFSLTFFVVPSSYYDLMYALLLPLSFIYAQSFIANKQVVLGNFMFILLLVACLLTYLGRIIL